MCVVCGCSGDSAPQTLPAAPARPDPVRVDPRHGDLHFGAGAARVSVPGMTQERALKLEADILGANRRIAERNRAHFLAHGVTALNLVSSPGAGKTTLLCATITALKQRAPGLPLAVIEGDQQTDFDAERIRATGAPAVQVNTGKGCHLDAPMVARAFAQLHRHDHAHDHAHGHAHGHAPHDDHPAALPGGSRSLLFIENVGNLVCPALWDLGEAAKVAVLSVTEGEDKPLKYPDMFQASQLMILNKVDLLPHLNFDVARCMEMARRVNPGIRILQVSATTGQGMEAWLHWLEHAVGHAHAHPPVSTVETLGERVQRLQAELALAQAALHAQAAG